MTNYLQTEGFSIQFLSCQCYLWTMFVRPLRKEIPAYVLSHMLLPSAFYLMFYMAEWNNTRSEYKINVIMKAMQKSQNKLLINRKKKKKFFTLSQ